MTAEPFVTAYATVPETAAVAAARGPAGTDFLALSVVADAQDNVLMTVALAIDALDYAGTPVSGSQPMSFPRNGARPDAERRIKQANIEEALVRAARFAVGAPAAPLYAETGNGNVKEDTLGPLTTVYFAPGTVVPGSLEQFSQVTRDLLRPLLAVNADPKVQGWGQSKVRRLS